MQKRSKLCTVSDGAAPVDRRQESASFRLLNGEVNITGVSMLMPVSNKLKTVLEFDKSMLPGARTSTSASSTVARAFLR